MDLLVVLVRTHSPGNLGAASRAVKNFGARLLLLEPRAERSHPDARAFASGAEDVLDGAELLATWDELERRADRVVALTSLRGRAARGLPPATTWPALRARGSERLALVFGPERGGLTTRELARCAARLSIPASPRFPTLNLAQAVAVALALAVSRTRPRQLTAEPRARDAEVRRLLSSFRATLAAAAYPGKGRSQDVLAEMESFLRRGHPTSREVTLLLGALAALRRVAGRA